MGVTLLCFPASDATFSDLANRALAEVGDRPAPDAVEGILRHTYPLAVLRVQESTAMMGFEVRWYAFRDGRVAAGGTETWWDEPAAARVVIDHTNRYIEANESACRLLGVDEGTLVGRSWEEFAEPETSAAAESLRQSMQQRGHAASTFQLIRPDGARFAIDYHTVVYISGDTVLYETVMRERPSPGS